MSDILPATAILEIEMEEARPIQVAQIYDKEENPMNGRVYDADGIAPTLRTPTGGLSEPKIAVSCALRGRNPNNPSDRTAGINTEQRLEIGSDVANCVTIVQKDSMLLEPIKIRQATVQGYIECPVGGGFDAAYPNSKLRRGRVQQNGDDVGAITASGDEHCVYEGAEVIGSMQANAMRGSIDGVSPCLTEAMGMGGGQIPMIAQMPHGYNSGGLRNGEVSPAITTSSWESNNMPVEPCGCYDNQFGEFAREPIEGVARTLKADHHNAVLLKYRIRKLTPRECFRLMGVDDTDIDKIDAYRIKTTLKDGTVKGKPIPKSQKYKMAGNSIVVSCLYYIFYQMFIAEPPKPKPIQKSLFD